MSTRTHTCRVEGQGKAVITDVIYSSETTSEEQQPASGTKEEYATLKVCVPLSSNY